MNPNLQGIFPILSGAISIYTVMCLVRVLLTWIPGAERGAAGRFLSRLCDPYLKLFRKLPLRFGALDISPVAALGVLWAVSVMLSAMGAGQKVTLALILAVVLQLAWQIVSSVLWMLLVVLVVRLIVLLASRSTYGTIWDTVDRSISPVLFKITSPFYRNRTISFKGSLIIAAVEVAALLFFGDWAVGQLGQLIAKIQV